MKTIMTCSSNNLIKGQFSTRVSTLYLGLPIKSCITFEIIDCRYTIYIMLKQKRHEQVEKTLEMKKWSRNAALVMKQCRNVYDVLAM